MNDLYASTDRITSPAAFFTRKSYVSDVVTGCCASASDDNSHSSTASPCVLAKIRTDGAISGCGSVVTSCATAASESYSPASAAACATTETVYSVPACNFPKV